jgi:LysR family hydrogen peroxide-inducible transcriptional activator
MVAAGYGCTLLPALAVQTGPTQATALDTRPLDLPDAKRRIGLLFRRSFPRRQGLERLGEAIVGCLPEGVRPLGTAGSPSKFGERPEVTSMLPDNA